MCRGKENWKKQSFCEYCGGILKGRSDKIYCNRTCKNRSNNIKSRQSIYYQIDQSLKRNRKILSYFYHKNKMKVGRIDLDKKRFDWQFGTKLKVDDKDCICEFELYEFKLVKLNHTLFCIQKRD